MEQYERTERTVDASTHDKGVRDALSANRSVEGSIREAVDNAITEAISNGRDEVDIDISITASTQCVVEDDAGGIKSDDFPDLFRLGLSGNATGGGGISAFGVGLESGAHNIGADIVAESHHPSENCTWMAERKYGKFDEELDLYKGDTLDEGRTRITYKANAEFDEQALKRLFRSKYQKYLRGEGYNCNGLKVNMSVNGDAIEAPDPPEFSFSPFQLHPRKFTIVFYPSEIDEPVFVDILVGTLAEGGSSGCDISVQGLMIGQEMKSNEGGFVDGIFGPNSPRKHRFRVQLDFYTEADDKSVLPWNESKTGIQQNEIWQKAMDWARRASEVYRQGYGKEDFTASYIRPFPRGSEGSVDGVYEGGTYDNREDSQFGDYESPSWNTIQEDMRWLRKTAERHARLMILAPSVMEGEGRRCVSKHVDDETAKKAYKELVIHLANSSQTGYWNVDEDIEKLTEDDFTETEEEPQAVREGYKGAVTSIKSSASGDKRSGVKSTSELEDWKKPLYKHEWKKANNFAPEKQSKKDKDASETSKTSTSESRGAVDKDELKQGIKEILQAANRPRAQLESITIEDIEANHDEFTAANYGLKTPAGIVTWHLDQMVNRSVTTSFGGVYEEYCKLLGAEELSEDDKINRNGVEFDLKLKRNGKTYYIQLKSGTNTMNIQMANNLDQAIDDIEEQIDNVTGLLGIANGTLEDVNNQTQSVDAYPDKVLAGEEFWNFIGDEEGFRDKLIEAIKDARDEVGSDEGFYAIKTRRVRELAQEWQERNE